MERHPEYDNEICPVCGYYCLGKGGMGCIDKPFLTGLKDLQGTQDKSRSQEKKTIGGSDA